MRLHYLLLVAANLLACSKASPLAMVSLKEDLATDDATQGSDHESRFLSIVKAAAVDTSEGAEERATMDFAGLVKDKADTKALLTSWLQSGKSLQAVGAKLGLANMPTEKLMFHPNWKTLVKFQRMKFEHTYGKKLPYAKFGTGYQTEEKTQDELMKWAMAGTSQKNVRKTLGLTKDNINLISHQNYKAYRTFVRWQAQWEALQKKRLYQYPIKIIPQGMC